MSGNGVLISMIITLHQTIVLMSKAVLLPILKVLLPVLSASFVAAVAGTTTRAPASSVFGATTPPPLATALLASAWLVARDEKCTSCTFFVEFEAKPQTSLLHRTTAILAQKCASLHILELQVSSWNHGHPWAFRRRDLCSVPPRMVGVLSRNDVLPLAKVASQFTTRML